jgi:hypothetical protein
MLGEEAVIVPTLLVTEAESEGPGVLPAMAGTFTCPCRFPDHKNIALRFSALLNDETSEVELALI